MDLHLSIPNGFVSSRICDKRDDLYISQLIRFAVVCSHVDSFNACNICLIAKLRKQGYRYDKAFFKF